MASTLSSFMFGNQAPAMVTSTGTASSAIPDWLTQYSQGLLSGANTLIPQTTSNLQTAQSPLSAAAPYLSNAQSIASSAINPANSGSTAASPFFSSATGQIGSALNPATGGLSLAQPFIGTAAGMTGAAVNPSNSGLSAAAPYLSAASGNWTQPGVASSYMNPYETNVTNYAGSLAGQQLENYILPQVEDASINSGQFGGSNMGRQLGIQLNQLGQNLNAQDLAALASGYGQGEQTYEQDVSRQGALGQTAGALGTQQQAAELQGAGQIGQLGSTLGTLGTQAQGLGLQGASELGSLGTAAGTLATQQQGAELQGAGQIGQLGTTAGQLGAAGNAEQIAQLGALGTLAAQVPKSTVQNISQTTPYNPATYGVQGTSPLSTLTGLANGTGALGSALGALGAYGNNSFGNNALTGNLSPGNVNSNLNSALSPGNDASLGMGVFPNMYGGGGALSQYGGNASGYGDMTDANGNVIMSGSDLSGSMTPTADNGFSTVAGPMAGNYTNYNPYSGGPQTQIYGGGLSYPS